MRFCSLIRPDPHYRADAFRRGLLAIGAKESSQRDADILIAWNRYAHFDAQAREVEKRGGIVLVAENAYLGNEWQGDRWYAISRSQHNGAGWWPVGDASRWDSLGVELQPFRTDGREIVVLPQRGIGPAGVAMPAQWVRDVTQRLSRLTRRNVRVRAHPGQREVVPLLDDLADAWAVVTWGSGAAIKALAAGIPVFHDLPEWIGWPAAYPVGAIDSGTNTSEEARLEMFRRLIWAQWRLSEIESGEAFQCLLS